MAQHATALALLVAVSLAIGTGCRTVSSTPSATPSAQQTKTPLLDAMTRVRTPDPGADTTTALAVASPSAADAILRRLPSISREAPLHDRVMLTSLAESDTNQPTVKFAHASNLQPTPDALPEIVPPGELGILADDRSENDWSANEEPFVVDLATALRLGGANNLQIQLARERVVEAQVQWKQSRTALLPNLVFGLGYNRHDGRLQATDGTVENFPRQSLFVGGGAGLKDFPPLAGGSGGPARLALNLSLADVYFEPLVQRQLYNASGAAELRDTNDTLRDIAIAYFDLLQAHAIKVYTTEGLHAAEQLVELTTSFFDAGQGANTEVYRAKAEHAFWKGQVEDAHRRSVGAMAELVRLLRLDPAVRLVPADEQLAPVALIDESLPVELLIATALGSRPELTRHSSLVAARLQRRRQERFRPWLPYVQLGASAGTFGGGPGGEFGNQGGRSDVDVLALWQVRNLGYGDLLANRERDSQLRQTELEIDQLQDNIIAQVITAAADVASYKRQCDTARLGVEAANSSFTSNFDRIREAVGLPIELVQAIRARTDAHNLLAKAISDYNRAQYRLLHAMGQPVHAQ